MLKGANGRKLADWNSRMRWVTSRTDRIDSSEVSLIMAMNSLPSGGTTMRSACGRMISRADSHRDSPRLWAASTCPLGTASIPERKISAM